MARWLILAALACAGCASEPPMSRDEYLSRTNRSYVVDREQLIRAARKVLELADPSDTVFIDSNEGFDAHRSWSAYFVIGAERGIHHWAIRTRQDGDKAAITVQVTEEVNAMTAAPIMGGQAAIPMQSNLPGRPLRGMSIYDLYFARLEYLLGQSKEWPDCEDWKGRRSLGGGRSQEDDVSPFCGATAKDLTP